MDQSEPDLSIIDVEPEQSPAGAGRDTDRVPDPRAPGGKETVIIGEIRQPKGGPTLPGKPEPSFVEVGTASEHLVTGSGYVTSWLSLKQPPY